MRRSKGGGRQGPTDRPQKLKSVLPEARAAVPLQRVPLPQAVQQPPPLGAERGPVEPMGSPVMGASILGVMGPGTRSHPLHSPEVLSPSGGCGCSKSDWTSSQDEAPTWAAEKLGMPLVRV